MQVDFIVFHAFPEPLDKHVIDPATFAERLWKSVKYEEVYLHAYDSVSQARQGLQRYFKFYNERRPHSSLDGKTPDSVYFDSLPIQQAA